MARPAKHGKPFHRGRRPWHDVETPKQWRPARAGTLNDPNWTADADAAIDHLRAQGKPWREVAAALGRSEVDVIQRHLAIARAREAVGL